MLGGLTNFLISQNPGGDIFGVSTWDQGKLDPLALNPVNQPGGKNWLLKNPGFAPVGKGDPMKSGMPSWMVPLMNSGYMNFMRGINPELARQLGPHMGGGGGGPPPGGGPGVPPGGGRGPGIQPTGPRGGAMPPWLVSLMASQRMPNPGMRGGNPQIP